MRDVCSLICLALIGLFRSRASLQVEILTLRHQLNVLRRKSPQRLTFTSIDRLVFAGLYRLAPWLLDHLKDRQARDRDPLASCRLQSVLALEIKTAQRPGDPSAHSRDKFRQPIMGRTTDSRRASQARYRCQTTVAKYMARGRRPPSQGWKTFLDNHADGIASMDLFVVPTISFRLLYGLLILQHDRRAIFWFW